MSATEQDTLVRTTRLAAKGTADALLRRHAEVLLDLSEPLRALLSAILQEAYCAGAQAGAEHCNRVFDEALRGDQ